MSRKVHVPALVAVVGVLLVGQACAVDWGQEYAQRLHASQLVSPLGDSLFGDNISLYNGTVSFSVTDISLPGNNSLPVELRRTYDPQALGLNQAVIAGRWGLDLPYLSGVFAAAGTYQNRTAPGYWEPLNRCSSPASVPQGIKLNSTVTMQGKDYWSGEHLHLPGGGGGELLIRTGDPKLVLPTNKGASPRITRDHWTFDCPSSLQSGQPGEGFIGYSPDGTTYTFDYMVDSDYVPLARNDPVSTGGPEDAELSRVESRLYPTLVTDRFGNSVSYTWTKFAPAWGSISRLTKIRSSDGREIDLTYNPESAELISATAVSLDPNTPSRTWTYGYDSSNNFHVVNPDGSQWTYSGGIYGAIPYAKREIRVGEEYKLVWDVGVLAQCWSVHKIDTTATGYTSSYTVTAPSGATATYAFRATRHGINNVPNDCSGIEGSLINTTPLTSDTQTLISKTVSGPGLATATTTYGYGSLAFGYQSTISPAIDGEDQDAPPHTRTVTVTESDDPKPVNRTQHVYTFGNDYGLNEGQLLKEQVRKAGVVYRTTTHTYVSDAAATGQPFPASMGTSEILHGDEFTTSAMRPLTKTVISQDGINYTHVVPRFDAFARPVQVRDSNDTGDATSRTDSLAYRDDLDRWLLGQPWKTTNNDTGLTVQQTDYDPLDRPTATYSFKALQSSFTYNADGTVNTVADGLQHITTLSQWNRGLPQRIDFANGVDMRTAVVNDWGWITAVTDENGYATGYGYDGMGRVAGIAWPVQDDVAWTGTTQSFTQVNTAEYGLSPGHWRQTVSTGNATKVVYFDALWRPVVTQEFDANNPAGTSRFTVDRYDVLGRHVFASYPVPVLGLYTVPTEGTTTTYDPLGRPISSAQSSETVPLITSTTYLGGFQGFQTKVTNPRGKVTTTKYQVFGSPDTSHPVNIASPEGVTTVIARDVFGKPLWINRSSTSGGIPVSATRSFVYDAQQRLCKRIEPETGATLTQFDAAGNTTWTAPGTTFTSTASCDNASRPANAIRYTYDERNRVIKETIPGSTPIAWGYYPDGALKTLTSGSGSGANVWTYQYDKRRLAKTESLAIDGRSRTITHGYDALGHESSLTYPSGLVVATAPNGLGQPTQAGSFATGVAYFPDGGMRGFTYGNGIVHSLTQNLRGLPERSVDQSPVAGVAPILDDTYAYDENGNVTSITDGTGGDGNSRTMQYDDLDRLTVTNAPHQWWKVATTHYDGLDNILTNQVGNTPAYLNTYAYDSATGRLASVTGRSNWTFGYDANGNVANRGNGGDQYVFDVANRMQSVIGKESYQYDGYGRRVKVTASNGIVDYPIYTMSGQLLAEDDQRSNQTIDYVSLNGSLVGKRSATLGTTTYANFFEHTDALHSPVHETDANGQFTARGATLYTPYGEPGDKNYRQGPGYTGHVTDAATGLTYAQQRYYDPVLGRFLSPDPSQVDDQAANFSRYWYADNNPYKFTDPDGRCVGTHILGLCPDSVGHVILIGEAALQNAGILSKNYTKKDGSVNLSPEMEQNASNLANSYHNSTGGHLVVTDGTRDAGMQAARMLKRINAGIGVSGYANVAAANEVWAAYVASVAHGGDPLAAMTAVINKQVAQGIYVSDHLRREAMDARRPGSSVVNNKLRQAAFDVGATKFLPEGKPIHDHIEFEGGH